MDQKPAKKKTAFNVSKLGLSAPNPQIKGVYANLRFDIFQNNPRISVDTRDPNKLNKENHFGRIEAAMTGGDLYTILEALDYATKSKEEWKTKIECYGNEWVNGQKSKDITLMSSVWVGRDAEGGIFISVVKENTKDWPVIKFLFGPTDQRYTKWYHGDGTPYTKQQASQLYAKGYVNMLRSLYAAVMDTHYWDSQANFPGGQRQGGGGGWNRGGQGGGGGGGNNYGNRQQGGGGGGGSAPAKASEDVMDDDMPF
jgi:hypothetical protein